MAEARHKPPMQPWLAPVSNRLFGWTENGCEGTSPSAELRFQHSASPPSAAGRFPRPDTLPPLLPRARPPWLRPGPAACAESPPLRGLAERGAGRGVWVWEASGLFAEPGLPGARIRLAAKVYAGFVPTVFPWASAKRDFSGLPLYSAPALSHVEVSHLPECSQPAPRFLRRGNQGQKLPAGATPEPPGGFEWQLSPGPPSAPRVFLVSLPVNFAKCTTLPPTWSLSSVFAFQISSKDDV